MEVLKKNPEEYPTNHSQETSTTQQIKEVEVPDSKQKTNYADYTKNNEIFEKKSNNLMKIVERVANYRGYEKSKWGGGIANFDPVFIRGCYVGKNVRSPNSNDKKRISVMTEYDMDQTERIYINDIPVGSLETGLNYILDIYENNFTFFLELPCLQDQKLFSEFL